MKRFLALLGLTCVPALANDLPRGNLIELHSCELYAGGCTVSSEAPQGGRYLLRVWDFSGGTHNKTDLKGLQLAVLQVSSDNMAMPDAKAGEAVVYLPAAATGPQRDALLAWFKASPQRLQTSDVRTRTVPMELARTGQEQTFTAGEFLSVKTGPIDPCDFGSCGEALWYEPRTATSVFTVAVNRSSEVKEPFLKLKWEDSRQRSVFLGRFGGPGPARDVYVSMTELCGPNGLF